MSRYQDPEARVFTVPAPTAPVHVPIPAPVRVPAPVPAADVRDAPQKIFTIPILSFHSLVKRKTNNRKFILDLLFYLW